jgi:asparagine synthase (glutamine-hydrolysing)
MCGIAGIFSQQGVNEIHREQVFAALKKMQHRGPDFHAVGGNNHTLLGHARLSIIDTSESSNQPFYSEDKEYALVFNGEIFNFPELKTKLIQEGVTFKTRSDTEVLLHLLIRKGKKALNELNGFFALAFYNFTKNELWLARDRFGEKPLKYSLQNNNLWFASDLNALKCFLPDVSLDPDSIQLYFQYNYIPAPFTIYKNVFKLMPGEMLCINSSGHTSETYYQIHAATYLEDEREIKNKLKETLVDAVKLRLISDVPLGSFLSGGIDSTIISGIAKELNPSIQTFSIGFPDQKHFDETPFAKLAARHLKTNHEVFEITGKKLLDNFQEVIEKMDEPFADSSALAVFELTRQTKNKITVALSGDGADELFGGYHKHLAHQKAAGKTMTNLLLKNTSGIFKTWKGSRHSKIGDKIRKIKKYSGALHLNPVDRYIEWASVLPVAERRKLFHQCILSDEARNKMDEYFRFLNTGTDLNEVLKTDILLVLTNDMLVKADMMSMANSLELRPAFLDYRMVELALQIPEKFKIKKGSKKNILKETFKEYLPDELVHRPKKGFEVPLHSWFNNELKNQIHSEWLNKNKYEKQSVFSNDYIDDLKKKIFSDNPGDSAATVWAFIVFWEWMKNQKMEL